MSAYRLQRGQQSVAGACNTLTLGTIFERLVKTMGRGTTCFQRLENGSFRGLRAIAGAGDPKIPLTLN